MSHFKVKLVLVLIIIGAGVFFSKEYLKTKERIEPGNYPVKGEGQYIIKTEERIDSIKEEEQCITKTEERTVRGESLSPLIKGGETVTLLFGYYNCREVERGDVVIFRHGGNQNLIIKIAKGLPGDKFNLKETDFGWNILINNQILKNSESKPYLVSGNKYKMLSLYEKDFKGVIPDNAYLILGNLTGGSLDSTQFGLIDKSTLLGKAESIYDF